jgi:hypothetical protein
MKIVTTLHELILVEYIILFCEIFSNKSFTVPLNTAAFSVETATCFSRIYIYIYITFYLVINDCVDGPKLVGYIRN